MTQAAGQPQPGVCWVCVIGAECTGKTTLAQQLAQRCGGLWVPEALRSWCAEHGRTPRAAEQPQLLARQIQAENRALARVPCGQRALIFCDTAPLLTAVYSQHYFGDAGLMPAALAHHRRYHRTLWLQPDLPWVADGPWRDGEGARLAVHRLLVQALAGVSGVVPIAGPGPQRAAAAWAAVAPICDRSSG